MKFNTLAKYFQRLEATSGRLEMMQILTELFNEVVDPEEGRMIAYLTLGEIHPPYTGLELGMSEKLIVRSIALASGYDSSSIDRRLGEVGDIGMVAEEYISKKKQATLFPQELTVDRVYNTLDKICRVAGEGSIEEKIKLLASLFVDSKPLEARYIARIADGVLRLGVADMTLLEALALKLGSRDYKKYLEEAYNVVPDIGLITKICLSEGLEGIKKVDIQLGVPLRPMLAERLKTPEEAWEKTGGKLAADFKYDGERMQIHKNNGKVNIFSRRLENITYQFPDVVDIIKQNVKADKVIIEGEAIAFDPETGEFKPFQELMRRKRKHEILKMIEEIPVTLRVFDVLYIDGRNLLKTPFPERRKILEEIIEPNDYIKPSELIYPKDIKDLEEHFLLAIENGCEGLVVKYTGEDSIYQAGARGWLWIKLKRDYQAELSDTLDLVVVGAFYGRGRKGGLFSSFLMAVYDDKNDIFKTICKVGTGFKDEDITEMNKILKPLLTDKKPARLKANIEPDKWVEPKIVLEITAAELTLSPIHTCSYGRFKEDTGLALRFPRFTGRYRTDKSPEDATTEKEIVEMFMRQRRLLTDTNP
jgi:DNA ligase-1